MYVCMTAFAGLLNFPTPPLRIFLQCLFLYCKKIGWVAGVEWEVSIQEGISMGDILG